MILNVSDLVEHFEGRRSRLYRDTVGKLTGGVGRNFDDVPLRNDEIDLMKANDIAEAQQDITEIFGAPFGDARWAALTDMRFNLGHSGFRAFAKMIDACKVGDWESAAREAKASKWASEVPNRANIDAEMLRTGDWPNVGV